MPSRPESGAIRAVNRPVLAHRMTPFWLRPVLFVLVCFAGVMGMLYAVQRSLIYFPGRMSRAEFEATAAHVSGTRGAVLAPFDAVVFEPPSGMPIVATAVYFHGNAGTALDRSYLAAVFTGRGVRLVLAEYPGYGARDGAPSQESLVDDARKLYAKVTAAYPASPLMLVGESLGSGVAVQVAASSPAQPPTRLVLLTPFLSLAETAARTYWFLPVRYLVKDRFDSQGRLDRYRGPVAILIAGRDEVVGASQGRELAALSRSRGHTVAVELPDAGHNNWSVLVSDAQWTELLGCPPSLTVDPAGG